MVTKTNNHQVADLINHSGSVYLSETHLPLNLNCSSNSLSHMQIDRSYALTFTFKRQ
jgi:hypothetical protein